MRKKFLIPGVLLIVLFSIFFLRSSILPPSVGAASPVNIDNITTFGEGISSFTTKWIHSISNFPNRLLLVGIHVYEPSSLPPTTVTCNGVPMTELISQPPSGAFQSYVTRVYYLTNPPVGDCQISVDSTFQIFTVSGAISLYNVDTANPISSVVGAGPASGLTSAGLVVANTNINQLIIGSASSLITGLDEEGRASNIWKVSVYKDFDLFSNYGSITQGRAGSTPIAWSIDDPNHSANVSLTAFAVNPATQPVSTIEPTEEPEGEFTISGNIFIDANRNGIKDSEVGYGGLTNVSLAGSAARRVTTDASGNYSFKKLYAGSYRVSFTLPAGYRSTTPITYDVVFP